MNRFMTHTISEDIIYYGVYSTSDDMWNGGDVLCAARKRFFETGTKQKKRSTIKTDSGTYSYSYVIESGTLLKYKKTKSGHTAEQTVQTPDGYCVEQFNDRHQIVKRSCYNRLHCWQRTEYLSDGMTALCITPSPDSETPALICESNGTSEVLYPFEVTLDKELTEKLNIMEDYKDYAGTDPIKYSYDKDTGKYSFVFDVTDYEEFIKYCKNYSEVYEDDTVTIIFEKDDK